MRQFIYLYISSTASFKNLNYRREYTLIHIIISSSSFSIMQETWTLCRILKRNASYRKPIQDWKEVARRQQNDPVVNMDALSSKICSNNNKDSPSNNNSQIYISFSTTPVVKQQPLIDYGYIKPNNQEFVGQQSNESALSTAAASSNSTSPVDFNEWLEHGNWNELTSIIELNCDPLF